MGSPCPDLFKIFKPSSNIFKAAFLSLSKRVWQLGHSHSLSDKVNVVFLYPQQWHSLLAVLKFYFCTCPLLMVILCIPFLLLFLPIWLSILTVFLLGCSKTVGAIVIVSGIVLNVPWGPFGTWLMNKIFDL